MGSDGVVDDCKWVVDLMVEGLTVVGLTTSGSLLDGSRWCHGWLCCGLRLVEAVGLCHGLRLVVLVD